MIDGIFQDLWREVDEERRKLIETGVEQMLIDPENRGLFIRENQFGTIISVDLSHAVPKGQVMIKQEFIGLVDD